MRQNLTYIFLTFFFISLSLFGIYYFFLRPVSPSPQIENITSEPTEYIQNEVIPTVATSSNKISPKVSVFESSPSASISVPTPTNQTFTSEVDKFTITYNSSRKLYQDKEFSGNRYTLYSPSGNIALHVGKIWSWTNPSRTFSSDNLLAGQPTYTYEATGQTIIDFQFNGLNYTFQCVHNDKESVKSECQQLIKNFKLNGTQNGS